MRSSTNVFICEHCSQPSGSFAPEQIFCSECIEKMSQEPTSQEKKFDTSKNFCYDPKENVWKQD